MQEPAKRFRSEMPTPTKLQNGDHVELNFHGAGKLTGGKITAVHILAHGKTRYDVELQVDEHPPTRIYNVDGFFVHAKFDEDAFVAGLNEMSGKAQAKFDQDFAAKIMGINEPPTPTLARRIIRKVFNWEVNYVYAVLIVCIFRLRPNEWVALALVVLSALFVTVVKRIANKQPVA